MKVRILFLVIALGTSLFTSPFTMAVGSEVDDQSVRDGKPIDGAPDEAELEKVQGKWVRSVKTANGPVQIIKEHKGQKTTLQFMDANGNVVASKMSEFRLEKTGRVRVFTFFNNVVTSGPQKGQVDKKEKSYIYRIEGDSFTEPTACCSTTRARPWSISGNALRSDDSLERETTDHCSFFQELSLSLQMVALIVVGRWRSRDINPYEP
jgi:hypothetical protein